MLTRLLNATVPDEPVFDAMRIAVVVFGAVMTGWVVGRWRRLDATCAEGKRLYVALVILWAPIWLTEAQQVGRPLILWRLPLALAGVPATFALIRWHQLTHHADTHGAPTSAARYLRRTLRPTSRDRSR